MSCPALSSPRSHRPDFSLPASRDSSRVSVPQLLALLFSPPARWRLLHSGSQVTGSALWAPHLQESPLLFSSYAPLYDPMSLSPAEIYLTCLLFIIRFIPVEDPFPECRDLIYLVHLFSTVQACLLPSRYPVNPGSKERMAEQGLLGE